MGKIYYAIGGALAASTFYVVFTVSNAFVQSRMDDSYVFKLNHIRSPYVLCDDKESKNGTPFCNIENNHLSKESYLEWSK